MSASSAVRKVRAVVLERAPARHRSGPLEAVAEFLRADDRFAVDRT